MKQLLLLPIFFLCLLGFSQVKKQKAKPGKPRQKGGVEVIPVPSQKRVDIKIDGKLFTSYRFPTDIKKPVLWPIISSSGLEVTRGFPIEPKPGERVDHPHHVGLWFNHGDVNGHDFWNNSNDIGKEHKGPFGTIVHKTIDNYSGSADKGELHVTSEWQDSQAKILLTEKTHFIFEKVGDQRFITRITKLKAGADSVKFEDNKEGMLGLRVARFLEHPSTKPEIYLDAKGNPTAVPIMNSQGVTGQYVSSEGLIGDLVWGKRANWVSLDGEKDGKKVSVVVFDHPSNFNYPTHWHARPYGLFSANPIGSKVFSEGKEYNPKTLPPQVEIEFLHRILIISGKTHTSPELGQIFEDWSNWQPDSKK
jgi:hypothetical protein